MTSQSCAAAAESISISGYARSPNPTAGCASSSSPGRGSSAPLCSGSIAASACLRRASAAGISRASNALGTVPLCPIILSSVTATSPNMVMLPQALLRKVTNILMRS